MLSDRWHVLYWLGNVFVRPVVWVWNAVFVPKNYLVIANFFKLPSLVIYQYEVKIHYFYKLAMSISIDAKPYSH